MAKLPEKTNNSLSGITLTFEDIEIGDIVDFAAKSAQLGLTEIKVTKDKVTTIYKHGQNKMFPPSMVVIEVVQEDLKNAHLIDERTGRKKKDGVKVLCQWFSEKTCKFQERWFNIGVLRKVEISENKVEIDLNQCVALKTLILANQQTTNILKNAIKDNNSQMQYTVTRRYENLSFLPPVMYVTSIEELTDKEKKPIYHKVNKGEKIRKCSDRKIKCMWFDYVLGKFSEHYFSPEALMNAEIVHSDQVIPNA